jgi:hypothetical protein
LRYKEEKMLHWLERLEAFREKISFGLGKLTGRPFQPKRIVWAEAKPAYILMMRVEGACNQTR